MPRFNVETKCTLAHQNETCPAKTGLSPSAASILGSLGLKASFLGSYCKWIPPSSASRLQSTMVDVGKMSPQRDWENPLVYERNRARMHVPLRSFTSKEAALQYFTAGPQEAPRPRIANLNSSSGNWAFRLYDRPEAVADGFFAADFDDQDWSPVSTAHSTCDPNVTADKMDELVNETQYCLQSLYLARVACMSHREC